GEGRGGEGGGEAGRGGGSGGGGGGGRRGRPHRETDAAAEKDESHAHGDHRHDRGLHQDIGEIEGREKTVGQQRGRRAQNDERDQRHLTREIPSARRAFHLNRRSHCAASVRRGLWDAR